MEVPLVRTVPTVCESERCICPMALYRRPISLLPGVVILWLRSPCAMRSKCPTRRSRGRNTLVVTPQTTTMTVATVIATTASKAQRIVAANALKAACWVTMSFAV